MVHLSWFCIEYNIPYYKPKNFRLAHWQANENACKNVMCVFWTENFIRGKGSIVKVSQNSPKSTFLFEYIEECTEFSENTKYRPFMGHFKQF